MTPPLPRLTRFFFSTPTPTHHHHHQTEDKQVDDPPTNTHTHTHTPATFTHIPFLFYVLNQTSSIKYKEYLFTYSHGLWSVYFCCILSFLFTYAYSEIGLDCSVKLFILRGWGGVWGLRHSSFADDKAPGDLIPKIQALNYHSYIKEYSFD